MVSTGILSAARLEGGPGCAGLVTPHSGIVGFPVGEGWAPASVPAWFLVSSLLHPHQGRSGVRGIGGWVKSVRCLLSSLRFSSPRHSGPLEFKREKRVD